MLFAACAVAVQLDRDHIRALRARTTPSQSRSLSPAS
jgi:hypothetical protein